MTGSLRGRLQAWLSERFETARATAGVNLRAMEGMRGFAVLLVFLTHYCTFAEPWLAGAPSWLAACTAVLHTAGNTGVDLFFVLSGYVIYKSLVVRHQPFGAFMARRVQRIYPAFLAVFVLYLALAAVFPADGNLPRTGRAPWVLANLLLLPGLFPIRPLFTVAWSLSYEMFFYLAVPLLVMVARRRGWGARRRVIAIVVCGIALAAGCALSGAGPIRMEMFLAGMLLHEAMVSRRVAAPGGLAAGLGLGIALAAGASSSLGLLKPALLFAGIFVVCLDCFRRPSGWLARAFGWTPLRWLGNMSYSYYLLHGLWVRAAFMALAHAAQGQGQGQGQGALVFFGMLPAAFALSVLGSSVLFLVVERPLSLGPLHARERETAAAAT